MGNDDEPPDFDKNFRSTDTNEKCSNQAIHKLVNEMDFDTEAATNKVREWYTFLPNTFFSTQEYFRDSENCLLCHNTCSCRST